MDIFFLFFSYLLSVITPQLKKHIVSVSRPFKKNCMAYTKEHRPLHATETHFQIIALRHSNAALTIDVPFSRCYLLDNNKKFKNIIFIIGKIVVH